MLDESMVTKKWTPEAQSPHHHQKRFVSSVCDRQEQRGDMHSVTQPKGRKRKVRSEECEPESKRRKTCGDGKSKHSMSEGPHGSLGAVVSISPSLVEKPVISGPVVLCVSEMESSSSTANISSPGTQQQPLTGCSRGVADNSFQTSHEQILESQQIAHEKLASGQLCSQVVSPMVVPETSESSVEVTEARAVGNDTEARSPMTKRQRKRNRQRKRKQTQIACTATIVPYL